MSEKLIIVGAGGFGKLLAELVIAEDLFQLLGFVDSNVQLGKSIFLDYKVIATSPEQINDPTVGFIVAIGNNEVRKSYFEKYSEIKYLKLISKNARIMNSADLGNGAIVMSNVVINSNVQIGKGSIIDTGSIIDHDSQIGAYSHLQIGTLVGSNTEVSPLTKTHIGEVIKFK